MLIESIIRTFKEKYLKQLNWNTKEKPESSQSIPKYSQPTGKPFLMGELDQMVQIYLRVLSKRKE